MSKYYLGIDLGTTYSCGAFINADGEPETIVNSESEKITPSVVYIEGENSVIVGQPAKDNSCVHPNEVISLVKNSMGKKNPDGSEIKFKTKYGDFTPEVISGYILKDIVADANAYLQPDEPITDVVVTVPAYFEEPGNMATDNAICIAGLHRIALLKEPTAAAFYYASKAKLNNCNIMVYDLGGGTFDVTIVHVNGLDIEVLSTGGMNKVGGSYFDKEIADKIFAIFEEQHGIDLTSMAYADVRQDVLTKVEKAKIQLSTAQTASIVVRADGCSETYTLTRDDLNEIVGRLYQKTETTMTTTLKKADLEISDIQKVILVGGSSRIPYIIDHIREFTGMEPSREVNPNEVVALGAALYAKQKMEAGETKIIDVCSHGIGIHAMDGEGKVYNDILIPSNSKLPCSVERVYKVGENAESLFLTVTEGDWAEITDVSVLSELDVPLPAKLKAGALVYVRLELDENQILHIYLRIPDADNQEIEIKFDRKNNMSEAEVSQWRQSVEKSMGSIAEKKESAKGLFAGLFGKKETESEQIKEAKKKAEEDAKVKEEARWKDIPKPVRSVMEDVVGMDEVIQEMRDYKNRSDMKMKTTSFLGRVTDDHCIAVLGAPGVGTTEASSRIVACLYKMGLITKEDPVWADYDQIVVGDEQKVKEAITNLFTAAQDGVLVIDDFERFYSDSDTAAGMIATDMLLKAYNSAGNKVILLIAGYPKEVKQLFEKKEKFARLFTTHTIEMTGYSAKEFVQILHIIAAKRGYVVDSDADGILERHLKGMMKMPDFKNIHYLSEVLLDEAITDVANKAAKIHHPKNYVYQTIRPENFQLVDSEESLEDLLERLNNLTGLQAVKDQVNELIANIQVQQRAEAEGRPLPENKRTMHMVFQGNAGTGKTTVAEIVGKIYRELGILARGQFVSVKRSDLVSDHVGGTALLVEDKVKEAMGGVLFIDEVHSLCTGDSDIGGKEAVAALVPLLENYRKDFVCIIAGYTGQVDEFLNMDPGLPERFPTRITFENYTLDEIMQIFKGMVSADGYMLEGKAEEAVRNELNRQMRSPKFSNARSARNLYERMVTKHMARLAKLTDWGEGEELFLRLEDLGNPEKLEGESAEELLAKLDAMTGLASVKAKVHQLYDLQALNAVKRDRGQKELSAGSMHLVFTGAPGTGKTTVARKIGSLYKAIGVLSEGHVVEASKATLVAGFEGQTAPNVKKIVESAIGGVLFIDEAYQLSDRDGSGGADFGKEAIDTLVAELENHRDNLVCIVAGYDEPMRKFIDTNPGLQSRFKNVIHFDDYSVEEKLTIFQSMAAEEGLTLADGVLERVRLCLEDAAPRYADGNARGVRNLLDDAKQAMATRLAAAGTMNNASDETLIRLVPEDIPCKSNPQTSRSLEELLEDLNGMVGLAAIKAQVNALVQQQQYNQMLRSCNLPTDEAGTMHMVFTGAPGTGKTSVARKIGEIYKALGLLPKGHLVETKRSELVAKFVGQSAPKLDAAVESAIGGVLFIDEAYQLCQGGENDFGKEVVEALVAQLENRRAEFVCIVAGYENDMRKFVASDDGLESRFTNFIPFEDYSLEEKVEIFRGMVLKDGKKMAEGVAEAVALYLSDPSHVEADGNARGVRNLKEKVYRNLSKRIVSSGVNVATPTDDDRMKIYLTTILPEDIY